MKIITTRTEALDAMLAKPLALQFPALDGFIVTEGHVRICREQGHTKHTFDGGYCQRCGDHTN